LYAYLYISLFLNIAKLGHLRKTKDKIAPSKETVRIIKESLIYQLEHELYEFAKEQFNFLKQRALKIDENERYCVIYFVIVEGSNQILKTTHVTILQQPVYYIIRKLHFSFYLIFIMKFFHTSVSCSIFNLYCCWCFPGQSL